MSIKEKKPYKILVCIVILFAITRICLCNNFNEMNSMKENMEATEIDSVEDDKRITFRVDSLETVNLKEDFCMEDYYITNMVTAMNQYYIDENSTLWGYGYNQYGQLGNGKVDEEKFYQEPIKIAENVVSVDASSNGYFCTYLTKEGKMYGVGTNVHGLLAQENEIDTEYYVEAAVVTEPLLLMEGVLQVSAGRDAIVVLKKDGSVWWWGQYKTFSSTKKYENADKWYGKNAEDETNPVKMFSSKPTKILENAIYVASGDFRGAAINRNGELYTWGLNIYGECGVSVTSDDFVRKPTKVLNNVKMVWPEKISFSSSEQEIPESRNLNTTYEFNTFVMLNDGTIQVAGKGVGDKEKEIAITGDLEKTTKSVYSDEFVPIMIKEYSEVENRQILKKLNWGMEVPMVEKILTEGDLRYQRMDLEGDNYIEVEESRYILYFNEQMKLSKILLQDGGSRDNCFQMGMKMDEIEQRIEGGFSVNTGDDITYWCQQPVNNIYYGFIFEDDKLARVIESEEGVLDECSVRYDDVTISLQDAKEDIIGRLIDKKIMYNETEEYLMLDSSVCLYFNNDNKCERISLLDSIPVIAKGIHKGDTISDMINQYGNDYEKKTYCYKGYYDEYRYNFEDFIMEFGVYDGDPNILLNVDIYSQECGPIYNHGPLLEKSDY